MYVDKLLEFSDAQAVTATARSTNILDSSAVGADIGTGRQLWCIIQCDVAMGGSSPTLDITLETDSVEAMSSATVVSTVAQKTALAVGDQSIIPVGPTAERFFSPKYTMGGSSPTVTLTAFLTDQDPQYWVAKADAL